MIALQGTYTFIVIGDGESSTVSLNLVNLKTPEPFHEGLLPVGVVGVSARTVAVKSKPVDIQVTGTLDGSRLTLEFQGAPLGDVEVTADLSFGNPQPQ